MPLIIDCKQVKTEIELQMSRVSSYDRYWTLRVSDKRSHTVIAEIEISEKEFSNFMSTAISAATGTIFQSNNHGKYSEVKRFEVEVPENARSYSDDSAWAAFMEAERVKCEAEGWRLDIDKSRNTHKFNPNTNMYSVIARRWVDNPPTENEEL